MLAQPYAHDHRPDMDGKAIGERVRRLREAKQPTLSQEALAVLAKTTRLTVANLELGKTAKPKYDTIIAIATALGADPRWLIDGDAPNPTATTLDRSTAQPVPLGTRENMELAAKIAGLAGDVRERFLEERRVGGNNYPIEVLIGIAKERRGEASGKLVDRSQALEVEDEPGAPRFGR